MRSRRSKLPHALESTGIQGLYTDMLLFSDSKTARGVWRRSDQLEPWFAYRFVRLQPPWCHNMIFTDLDVDPRASSEALAALAEGGLAPSFTTWQRVNSGQASFCLSEPVHLPTAANPNVSFRPIRYYKEVCKVLKPRVHASTQGHGRSRQRNPMHPVNNGRLFPSATYTLDELAAAVGMDRAAYKRRAREVLEFETDVMAAVGNRFAARAEGTFEQRLAAAKFEALHVYPGARNNFLALRVMRGYYRLAHDVGPNGSELAVVLQEVNEAMPHPYRPGDGDGVYPIVNGLLDSFATGKIYGLGKRKMAFNLITAKRGGAKTAGIRKEAVKPRNDLIRRLSDGGLTYREIVNELPKHGYDQVSLKTISRVVRGRNPLLLSQKQKHAIVFEQWQAGRNFTEIGDIAQVTRQSVAAILVSHIERHAAKGLTLTVSSNAKMTKSLQDAIKRSGVRVFAIRTADNAQDREIASKVMRVINKHQDADNFDELFSMLQQAIGRAHSDEG